MPSHATSSATNQATEQAASEALTFRQAMDRETEEEHQQGGPDEKRSRGSGDPEGAEDSAREAEEEPDWDVEEEPRQGTLDKTEDTSVSEGSELENNDDEGKGGAKGEGSPGGARRSGGPPEGGAEGEGSRRGPKPFLDEPCLAYLRTAEDFGFGQALADFIAWDVEKLHLLVPLVKVVEDSGPGDIDPTFISLCCAVFEQLQPVDFTADVMADDVWAIRSTVRNLMRRRAQVLDMEATELRQRLPPDYELDEARVEVYMRAHRHEFERSWAQALFCGLDRNAGLSNWQVKKRMDNRLSGQVMTPIPLRPPGFRTDR